MFFAKILTLEKLPQLHVLPLLFDIIETFAIPVIWLIHLPIWIPVLKENFCMHQYVYIYLVIDMLWPYKVALVLVFGLDPTCYSVSFLNLFIGMTRKQNVGFSFRKKLEPKHVHQLSIRNIVSEYMVSHKWYFSSVGISTTGYGEKNHLRSNQPSCRPWWGQPKKLVGLHESKR